MTQTTTLSLEFATSMLGSLAEDSKKKILAYLKKPTEKKWDKIYCLIINGRGLPSTVWQAVLEVDPFFQRSARMKEDCTTRWHDIPSKETVIKAIQLAVFKMNSN